MKSSLEMLTSLKTSLANIVEALLWIELLSWVTK